MANYNIHLLLVALVLFESVQEGISTLKCYRCTSKDEPACSSEEILKHPNLIIDCPNHTDVCGKHVRSQDMDSHELTMRGCVGKAYCDEVVAKFCQTCSEDSCNSSVSLGPHFGIAGLLVFIKFWLL